MPLMRYKIASEIKESPAEIFFSCVIMRHTPNTHRLFLESIIKHTRMDMRQRKKLELNGFPHDILLKPEQLQVMMGVRRKAKNCSK